MSYELKANDVELCGYLCCTYDEAFEQPVEQPVNDIPDAYVMSLKLYRLERFMRILFM